MTELLELFLGIILGYISISITESLSHSMLLHATPNQVKKWRKLGIIGKHLYSSWYSHHVVHHFRTFRTNHVTMFDSHHQRKFLESEFIDKGKEYILLGNYGLTIGDIRLKIQYLYTHILQIFAISYLIGTWGTVGVFIVVVLYIFAAEYIHPYLHLSHDTGIKQSTPLMKFVLNTQYFKQLMQHHYLHHKYINCNFNLLLGGDYLLGVYRKPNSVDISEMNTLGLITEK